MGKMNVILVGLPLFCKRLEHNLKEFDSINSYEFLNTYYNSLDKLKALIKIPKADCIFSINGSITKSKVFDMAFKNNVPVIMNWVGTDVLIAINAFKQGDYNKEYISNAIHFCEVDWIKEELEKVGIDALVSNYMCFDKKLDNSNCLNKKLSVLSYVSNKKPDFYGIKEIITLAKKNPNINFNIVGTEALDYYPLPNNINAHGWVEDMNSIFNDVHICIRFTQHDGLSNFVLEALSRGKQVLYNNRFNHCIYSKSEEDLHNNLFQLYKDFTNNNSLHNQKGIEYIQSNFNSNKIINELIDKIKLVVHNK